VTGLPAQPRPWDGPHDGPHSPTRLAELERAAAVADATGDVEAGLAARFALIDAYLGRGERWRLVEPVRRCRELLAAAPGPGGERAAELRRYQRFAVEAVFTTPRVGLDQARATLDDLARSASHGPARNGGRGGSGKAGGAGDAPSDLVAELRCRLADHLGDEPAARRWYDRWRAAPADPAAGCPGCAPSRRAELLAGWGDWAAALAELRPILDGAPAQADAVRAAHCTEQPERALAEALVPLLRAGEPERAARAHVEAYRRHRRERAAFPYLAAHLRFCALGGHLDRGLDVLAEQLPRLGDPTDDLATMEFAAAGALLCALATETGRGGRRMPLPGAAGQPPDGEADGGQAVAGIEVVRLGGLLAELATGLAGSFDARNGTSHQSGRIAARLAERPIDLPVPLPDDEPDDTDPGDDADPGAAGGGPAPDEPGALTVDMVTAALDRRGDAWTMRPGGAVVGRWGSAVIEFRRVGERGEVLHARVLAVRRLPAERRAEAYAFCNAWNHDRLLPKAYAHDDGGELVLAGDVTTDLAHGVAPAQLDVLVTATVATGVAYAEAVGALP
jgi:hypothetical protein